MTTPTITAHLQPGELVVASVRNPIENPAATGKPRPVVLIRSAGSMWHVMGLTTKPRYQAGAPRTPVPNPSTVGLDATSYLWGDRLTSVCRHDIYEHLGWADLELAVTINWLARLPLAEAINLLRSAVTHHHPAPSRAA